VVLEQHAARAHARVELVDDAVLGRLVDEQRVGRRVAARVQALGRDELAHVHVRERRARGRELRERRLAAPRRAAEEHVGLRSRHVCGRASKRRAPRAAGGARAADGCHHGCRTHAAAAK
jgi:hypothetical protein